MSIDFNSSPEELFNEAAKARHLAHLKLDEARASLAPLEAAAANADANLEWVGGHPALAQADKGALYQAATAGLTLEDAEPKVTREAVDDEPAKPKRRRRTKAEIEAEKAAEEAKASEGAAAAQPAQPEAAPAQEAPAAPAAVAPPAPAAAPAPVPAAVQQAPAPVAAPAPAPVAPAPAPVAGDPFDPFGLGAN